jgi:hypothetical protein
VRFFSASHLPCGGTLKATPWGLEPASAPPWRSHRLATLGRPGGHSVRLLVSGERRKLCSSSPQGVTVLVGYDCALLNSAVQLSSTAAIPKARGGTVVSETSGCEAAAAFAPARREVIVQKLSYLQLLTSALFWSIVLVNPLRYVFLE